MGSANNLNLRFSENLQKSDVSLVEQAKVEVAGKGQGSVVINARDINIFGESLISVGIRSASSAAISTSQDIILNATDSTTINQNSQVKNEVGPNANGNAGNISISARKVKFSQIAKSCLCPRWS